MKKTLPILLISLICLNIFGFSMIFNVLLYSCKINSAERIKSNIITGKTTLIILTDSNKKEIQRVNKKEILYHEKMYDIVSEVKKSKATYIYCLSDEKEDNIMDILNDINNMHKGNALPANKSAEYVLINLIKNFIDANNTKINQTITKTIYHSENINYTSFNWNEVLVPPPQFPLA